MTGISRARFLGLATGAIATGLLAACSSGKEPTTRRTSTVQTPRPVMLSVPDAPKALTIGLIATLGSSEGEGSQWTPGIGGARVAASRLAGGGTTVNLVAVDDKGTRAGAQAAVRTLVAKGAGGIVCASSGTHLASAVDAARHSRIPMLIIHPGQPGLAGDGVWLTGGTTSRQGETLVKALATRSLSHTVLLDAGGTLPDGVHQAGRFRIGGSPNAKSIATALAPLTKRKTGKPDSILIAGTTESLARGLSAVQGAGLGLPVFLAGDASAPTFAAALSKAGGSTAGDLTCAGPDTGDDVAMRSDGNGQAMTAYLSALRTAAGDTSLQDFFDKKAFSTIAPAADVASHDAVIALVNAAGRAGGTDASAIRGAMTRLELDHGDGLAGPALNLTRPDAMASGSLVALAASTDNLGLRPGSPGGLSWFKAPATT